MKHKIILFSSLLFFISHSTWVKAMLFAPKKHRLDDIAQQIYENLPDGESSIFIASPELFLLTPHKKAFVEFVQKEHSQPLSTSRKSVSQEKNLPLEAKK
jgi:hypothetical protein